MSKTVFHYRLHERTYHGHRCEESNNTTARLTRTDNAITCLVKRNASELVKIFIKQNRDALQIEKLVFINEAGKTLNLPAPSCATFYVISPDTSHALNVVK